MICGRCKAEKPPTEFTKLNRSKDGRRGLCKACKQARDADQRAAKEAQQAELRPFLLAPDLLIRPERKARVGVLMPNNIVDREASKGKSFLDHPYRGLQTIIGELAEPWDYTPPEHINDYEFVLVSLTSVMDVENLIYTMERFAPAEVKATIVIGGFGCMNIKLLLPYIDIACWGRAEGQINDILAGRQFPNVWRKVDDPHLEGKYVVRQPRYLLSGEDGVGCKYRCRYCQYGHVRLPLEQGRQYSPGLDMPILETDWLSLDISKPGRYNAAWDGWSQATRFRVAKPIRDSDITGKLLTVDQSGIGGTVIIKVFQIVGYPWETPESVLADIDQVGAMLRELDSQLRHTRFVLRFLCTPFGPEPLTPMAYDPANIHVNWREVLADHAVYSGRRVAADIIPAISGPFTLAKRALIHRSEAADLPLFKAIAFNGRLKRMPERWKVPWLLHHGHLKPETFGRVESAAFDYLSVERMAKPVTQSVLRMLG